MKIVADGFVVSQEILNIFLIIAFLIILSELSESIRKMRKQKRKIVRTPRCLE